MGMNPTTRLVPQPLHSTMAMSPLVVWITDQPKSSGLNPKRQCHVLDDETMVNAVLVADGYARASTFDWGSGFPSGLLRWLPG